MHIINGERLTKKQSRLIAEEYDVAKNLFTNLTFYPDRKETFEKLKKMKPLVDKLKKEIV